MIGHFQIGGKAVRVDFDCGTCIAIALDFAGPQPCHFGAAPASVDPMAVGRFVGDTRRGGSCNVPILTLNPHCNGTHTESVAHIVDQPVPVHEAVPGGPVAATLVTVTPVAGLNSGESYRPALTDGDSLITAIALDAALKSQPDVWLEAVVVRTRPNDPGKRTRRYGAESPPPFLSIEAIDYLTGRGVRHLLVDLPSVDRMHDDGLLTVHHRFWSVPERSHTLTDTTRRDRTITEMVYVTDTLPDGPYLLTLHVPTFCSDAAPARPWLFPVEFG